MGWFYRLLKSCSGVPGGGVEGKPRKIPDWICEKCGFLGRPEERVGGSVFLELCFWGLGIVVFVFFLPVVLSLPLVTFLLLIIVCFAPGFLYTLWRSGKKRVICPRCGNPNAMIPTRSPRGQKLIAEYHPALVADPAPRPAAKKASVSAVSGADFVPTTIGQIKR